MLRTLFKRAFSTVQSQVDIAQKILPTSNTKLQANSLSTAAQALGTPQHLAQEREKQPLTQTTTNKGLAIFKNPANGLMKHPKLKENADRPPMRGSSLGILLLLHQTKGNLYHTVTNPNHVQSITSTGFVESRLNPNSRFGKGAYFSFDPDTTYAELNKHKADISFTLRQYLDLKNMCVLDLSDEEIASELKYDRNSEDYTQSQKIAAEALKQGYEAILYPSAVVANSVNLVVIRNFQKIKNIVLDLDTCERSIHNQIKTFEKIGAIHATPDGFFTTKPNSAEPQKLIAATAPKTFLPK